jgi:GT2 family glycosyltransferase
MPAYQAERWIGATLESILAQTSPAHEIVVVDDGSTDATGDVARAFGAAVRVVSQPNSGASAAYNRAFRETEGSHVAMCPADDLWEPRKLELQVEALTRWPEIDVAFGGARYFGLEERDCAGPLETGILDSERFFRDMFRADLVPAPTAVVRRRLFEELGGFREDLACEDYEFWMRALRRGAVFFHDPRLLAHLRQHGGNLSAQAVSMWEMNHQIHSLYAPDLDDERLARRTLAHDLRTIGRSRLGLGQIRAARRAYRASLAHVPHPAALTWTAVLSLPGAGGPLRRLAARRRARATSP